MGAEKRKRPYLFAMGTDFSKMKAPLIWYDILHVTDVLTQIPWALEDHRLHEMIEVINQKADEIGSFTAESIWMDWKTWEFGQKKEPVKMGHISSTESNKTFCGLKAGSNPNCT